MRPAKPVGMSHPRFTPLVASLPDTVPFVGAEVQERSLGRPFAARLGANECVFGPSPKAVEAMSRAASDVWKYGDSASHDLREALAAQIGVTPANVIVGEGIDGLLGYLVRLMVAPGDAVVTSDGAYPTFNYHVAGYGGILHKVPYRDDTEDEQALVARAAEVDAKLIYLANPDNPMGTWLQGTQIVAMLDALPEGCLLVLDEAYAEFAPAQAVPDIDITDPRVIRMRTFSKCYGMAGARVGYALGAAPLIAAFDKIRNHFGMSRISQAGALAALGDTDYLKTVLNQVSTARSSISALAIEHELKPIPSATNFVAIDCGEDVALARNLLTSLANEGIFVRMPLVAPQNRCIRISAGTPTDIATLAAAFPRALEAARHLATNRKPA